MNRVRAIETSYKGFRFRSRLEARWAVCLDHIGWSWDYEPEGFNLPSGRYLPDFLLLSTSNSDGYKSNRKPMLWIEVKGQEPTPREYNLLYELAVETEVPAVFAIGQPFDSGFELSGFRHIIYENESRKGTIKQHYVERFANINSYCFSKWCRPGWLVEDSERSISDIGAMTAARSARFEHGAAA